MPSSVKASPFRIYKKPDFIAGNDWKTNLNQVVPVINDKPVITTTKDQEKMDIELDLTPDKQLNGGPTQPEMQAFTSVNSSNMVDLFTGDFSYNIPLLDVGGYPVNIAYRAGTSMDEDASWVGLGWNINPGTITRNMRGLPDEFDGKYDSITKTVSIKDNRTIGVSLSGDIEVVGLPLNLTANFGMFHNNYKGWGLEYGLNASLNSAIGSKGSLTSGLSFNNNSQDGLTLSPSLSLKLGEMDENNKGNVGTFSVSSPYNSRYGIRALNLTAGIKQNKISEKNSAEGAGMGSKFSSHIAFASPAFMPSITMPFTNRITCLKSAF